MLCFGDSSKYLRIHIKLKSAACIRRDSMLSVIEIIRPEYPWLVGCVRVTCSVDVVPLTKSLDRGEIVLQFVSGTVTEQRAEYHVLNVAVERSIRRQRDLTVTPHSIIDLVTLWGRSRALSKLFELAIKVTHTVHKSIWPGTYRCER
jgi:hypothetical protein